MNDDSISIKSCDEPQLLVRALWDENRAIAYVDERASRPSRFKRLASFKMFDMEICKIYENRFYIGEVITP